MSKEKKKRCQICHKWFSPDPRTAHKQNCCSSQACQKQRRSQTNSNWWDKNPDYGKSRKAKIRRWAAGPPSYWQKYRHRHTDYVNRDNKRRKFTHQKAQRAAKQDQIAKISVEKIASTTGQRAICAAKQDQMAIISVERLESIRALTPSCAANQTPIQRRINDILDYLVWKETAAKQDSIAFPLADERQYEYAGGAKAAGFG